VKTCARGFASEFMTFLIKNRETPFMSWDFLGERMFVASIISPGVTLTPAKLRRGILSSAGEFLKKFSAKSGTLFWSIGLICSIILEGIWDLWTYIAEFTIDNQHTAGSDNIGHIVPLNRSRGNS
jgi:hypothetical protein